MKNKITLIDDLYWPKVDTICRPYTLREETTPEYISKFVKEKRNVVQAGGNIGLYAKKYSELFKNVYTFEPEHINFHCLNLNATEPNIFKYQCCLGFNSTPVNLDIAGHMNDLWKIRDMVNGKLKVVDHIVGANTGAYHVDGYGNIPVINLDSLNLSEVDLIHFDIEGFEANAILGSITTIKKCMPVITLELKYNHGSRYNWPTEAVIMLMSSIGYTKIDEVGADSIFVHKDY